MSEPVRRYTIVEVERLSDLNQWCREEDVAALEAKLEAMTRTCRRLLDLHDFCPTCTPQTAGQYGPTAECADWRLFYHEAALATAQEKE